MRYRFESFKLVTIKASSRIPQQAFLDYGLRCAAGGEVSERALMRGVNCAALTISIRVDQTASGVGESSR
jgi:hypothetical protein